MRALRPHIGARLPLPGGEFMGVLGARVDGDTLAPAGGRVRVEDGRLLLDCNGGALELTEIRPPGGREMDAARLAARPPGADRTGYFLDPSLPGRTFDELVELAPGRVDLGRRVGAVPVRARLPRRRGGAVPRARDGRGRRPARARDRRVPARPARHAGAHVPGESAAALEAMAAREQDPGVLEAIAHGFGHLGEPYGLDTLLRALPPRRRAACARRRRSRSPAAAARRAVDALIRLSRDEHSEVRDWATFALGMLAAQDTEELREALAARLDDPDAETRLEAVHGLALRGDARAVEPALELLAEAARVRGRRDVAPAELRETAQRLAAQTGDERFEPYLPDRWLGGGLLGRSGRGGAGAGRRRAPERARRRRPGPEPGRPGRRSRGGGRCGCGEPEPRRGPGPGAGAGAGAALACGPASGGSVGTWSPGSLDVDVLGLGGVVVRRVLDRRVVVGALVVVLAVLVGGRRRA